MADSEHRFFRDAVIQDRLGSYVYALVDPRTNNVFYVGKAGGRDAQGNTRPEGHLAETTAALKLGVPLTKKQAIIADIWQTEREPQLVVVRRQLAESGPLDSEDVAFEVEGALIEVLQQFFNAAEGNKVSGHHKGDRGLLIGREIEAVVGAQVLNPSAPIDDVWVFNISRAIGRCRSPDEESLYKAVSGDWAIGLPSKEMPGYAVGLVGGIARVVCRVSQWHQLDERNGRRRRKRFDGMVLDERDPVGRELLHRDFAPITSRCRAWLRGQPLRVDFDGQGLARPTYNGPRGAEITLVQNLS